MDKKQLSSKQAAWPKVAEEMAFLHKTDALRRVR